VGNFFSHFQIAMQILVIRPLQTEIQEIEQFLQVFPVGKFLFVDFGSINQPNCKPLFIYSVYFTCFYN
jgi:hypothetical protein